MRTLKAVMAGIVGVMLGASLLLAFALISQSMPNAQATPAIGKGQPCNGLPHEFEAQ